jgi:hypothetical protein
MVTSGWLVVPQPTKDVLSCATAASGAQSVTMGGTILMPVLPADKLDTLWLVIKWRQSMCLIMTQKLNIYLF